MTSLGFFHLVLADPMSVAQAAQRYGCSKRTIRRWCQELSISHRVAGGPHRISVPLADLYAFGRRAELNAFLDGKPPVEIVCEAFEHHRVLEALVDNDPCCSLISTRTWSVPASASCPASRP
jgi:Helix-turn-helix domain